MNNKWIGSYPRPQLVRRDWLSLDGEWTFNGNETINVPFCPESMLSGIGMRIGAGETMIYERSFEVPRSWDGRRIILHFGAVDQVATVYVNGAFAGSHEGGYLPFSFDVTEFIVFDGSNDIRVEAVDELDHKYPWGKQKEENGGMWYTPVSGIWQSVWLEPAAAEHVTSLKIDTGLSWVEIRAYGITSGTIYLLGEEHRMVRDENTDEKCASIHIDIHRPHLWTPEDPYLYEFTIESDIPVAAGENMKLRWSDDDFDNGVCDRVSSYFALRTLTIEKVGEYRRLCLNGRPYFFNGVLDQGYWYDGIYTPEGPEAFDRDILAMKSLGFNTLRKHVKIEPEQFYYACDRLGMAVFQDMVNNSDYSYLHDTAIPFLGVQKLSDAGWHQDPETREVFLASMDATVRHLYNHPSICLWTIFNEGWGQFDADNAYDRLKDMDSTRFIDSTSGWFRQNRSDVDSYHIYYRNVNLTAGSRPLVIKEVGGYPCMISGHSFINGKPYGYGKFETEAELLDTISNLYRNRILPLIERGLCASIYTQLSDIEDETNGLLTYDREVQKIMTYTGTGRIEIIGNHTDHQGGRVMVAPAPCRIRAQVADNHRDVIRIVSEGFEPFEVSLTDRSGFKKGTTEALVTGILDGFVDLFGSFDAAGRGFDAHISSEVAVGSGLSSSAAFEILIARIINERFFGGLADAVQIAKIGQFAESAYYGKPCGLMDQLAISLGRMAMIDFEGREPEIELIDFDFDAAGIEMQVVTTESDHADLDDDYASVPDDMFKVAEVLGVKRLRDLNEEQFKRKLPMLKQKVADGELNDLQIARAKHFYEENERVLAAAIALKTGNIDRFLQCINASGLSSENQLCNVVPPGLAENGLSRALADYRSRPDTAAVRLIGGGFGGSILVFRRK